MPSFRSKMSIALITFIVSLNNRFITFPKLKKFYLSKGLEGPIIFDIGANKGQSINFFHSIFNKSTIYAFEPIKKLYKDLKKFENQNVFPVNIGLSNTKGTKVFYECIFNEISSFEKPNINSNYFKFKSRVLLSRPESMIKEINIIVSSLDAFLKDNKIDQIDICKIDIEGHELECLKGATNALSYKLIKLIQIEVHENNQYKNGFREVNSFLTSFNYNLRLKIKNGYGNFYDLIYEAN